MSIQLIYSFFSAIVFILLEIYVGSKIFKQKGDLKRIDNILAIIVYIIFLMINAYIVDTFLRTIASCIALGFFYKMLYRKDWTVTISTAFIVYLLILTAELLFCGLIGLNIMLEKSILAFIVNNYLILNIIIAILVIILELIFNKIIEKFIIIQTKYNEKSLIIMFLVLLVILTLLITRIDLRKVQFDFEFYINIGIFVVIIAILCAMVIQKYSYSKFSKKYSELADYSTINDEVLEEYRIKSHEYKNQLAIIKSMIEPKNKELSEYVDNLIEKNKNSKYNWINQVKYIKLPGLKGLLNYKIMEFNSLKITNKIIISKNISKEEFNNFTVKNKDDLYSIIGVYLDNAKEAALESKNNEISIEITKNEDYVIIKIANSYNKNNVDLKKMDDYKYTTKGKNRGIGLHLVKRIISNNLDLFKSEREVTKNYFIQTLYIKIK